MGEGGKPPVELGTQERPSLIPGWPQRAAKQGGCLGEEPQEARGRCGGVSGV